MRPTPPENAPARQGPAAEEGFVLIEVLVSALVLALVAAGVAALLSATTRSAADERNHSEAYSLAQEDLSRMRSMRISELARLPATPRTVTLNSTKFEIKSSGTFVSDSTATSSCTEGSSSADYVSVASEVTWTKSRNPVVLKSIITPVSGALDPSHGNVTFSVKNGANLPLPGVTLTSSAFTGTTDENGCVTFPDIATASYTVTPSGSAVGRVDKDGKAPAAMSVSVAPEVTTLVQLAYDIPGGATVSFTARPAAGAEPKPVKADSIVVSNVKMTETKSFGTPGGTRSLSIAAPATSLFPFSTADAVYAGSCGNDNPNPSGETNGPGAAGVGSLQITPNGNAAATVQLPALYLNVWKGTPSKPETLVSAPHVITIDKGCKVGTNQVKRTYTGVEGHLPPQEVGLPWGTYEVCADNGSRRQTITTVSMQDLINGTTVNIYLGSGIGTVSTNGVCS